jgi:hypothetical protein
MLRDVPKFWIALLGIFGGTLMFGPPAINHRNAFYEQRRQTGMHEVVKNAQPVIAAIRAYEKQHGKPPESLEVLHKTIPSPGPMAKYGWSYEADKGVWTLAVSVNPAYTTKFFLSGDTFVYHSDGQYKREAYGGILERFGAWGYYWE